ncbi:hypothetical protein W97_08889 [Coniosporium apollinis CBS 100218]|uniref:Uncharacterized protein n=1 Tax=Coniosporium apollinis (strain CBS 100218) TaxID=1168221 RepID=R7Z6K7_CONA1|nr:uncharacterized protein W97_08889 [Coniosporium apollinis CBS 100218]EON69629.1 hypothetical protein W97_08889 [Coniosporium apollinis CBS 100218]
MRWEKFGTDQYMKAVEIAEHWTWLEPAIHKIMAGGKSVDAARTEVVSLYLVKLHGSWSVNPNEATRCTSLLKRLDQMRRGGFDLILGARTAGLDAILRSLPRTFSPVQLRKWYGLYEPAIQDIKRRTTEPHDFTTWSTRWKFIREAEAFAAKPGQPEFDLLKTASSSGHLIALAEYRYGGFDKLNKWRFIHHRVEGPAGRH